MTDGRHPVLCVDPCRYVNHMGYYLPLHTCAVSALTTIRLGHKNHGKRRVVGAHTPRYADRNFGATTVARRPVSATSAPVAASARCTPKVSAAPPRAR